MNKIDYKEIKDVSLITPHGEMTFFFLEGLDNYLKSKIQNKQFRFIFDFSDVRWVDSMGLGLIAMTVKVALVNSTRVCVVNPRENVIELLRLSSLLDLIKIVNDKESAMSFFGVNP